MLKSNLRHTEETAFKLGKIIFNNRYFLRVTITKKFGSIVKEQEFLVINPVIVSLDKKEPVKNEVYL